MGSTNITIFLYWLPCDLWTVKAYANLNSLWNLSELIETLSILSRYFIYTFVSSKSCIIACSPLALNPFSVVSFSIRIIISPILYVNVSNCLLFNWVPLGLNFDCIILFKSNTFVG